MRLVHIPLERLVVASWNANVMEAPDSSRLTHSFQRFGIVQNLVVRPKSDDSFEVIAGNQRLQVLRQQGAASAPCLVVEANDAHARLLAQALNHIHGEDDLGLRAELIRTVLESVPEEEVLSLLPETAQSLQALSNIGIADIADYLETWQSAQSGRLRHLTLQLTEHQLHTVERAIKQVLASLVQDTENPNRRSTALAAICHVYLESKEGDV